MFLKISIEIQRIAEVTEVSEQIKKNARKRNTNEYVKKAQIHIWPPFFYRDLDLSILLYFYTFRFLFTIQY